MLKGNVVHLFTNKKYLLGFWDFTAPSPLNSGFKWNKRSKDLLNPEKQIEYIDSLWLWDDSFAQLESEGVK